MDELHFEGQIVQWDTDKMFWIRFDAVTEANLDWLYDAMRKRTVLNLTVTVSQGGKK